jgi:superoxide dismutase
MNAVAFLEQLANNTHHGAAINELVNKQSDEIKKAFLANDTESLKKQISDTEHFANNVAVAYVHTVVPQA